jgi:tRNA-splicing ligase RtcB
MLGRVWGADGTRCLSKEVVGALRSVIKRAPSQLPIALMADYHPAEVGVVGSVVASEEDVIPDLIGGDCGCGVFAVATGVPASSIDTQKRRKLYERILQTVPVGTAQNAEVLESVRSLPLWDRLVALPFVSGRDLRKLRYHLGTLGGGNHFVEIATDPDQQVWVLIHTGSRYLGGLLRQHYLGRSINVASDEIHSFILQQDAVLDYARASRREVGARVVTCLAEVAHRPIQADGEQIDVPHNFIEIRVQSSGSVALHRKGACPADVGQVGLICGSMLTGSYVVEGRGAASSYLSSSHGAGRLFSRGEAFRTLSKREVERDMEGIVWSGSERLKDEAPRAYKDLDTVMRSQRDLVRVRHHLKPVISVKGEA